MTFEEEIKILGEINKEIIKKGRLLYSYEFRGILDKLIVKSDEHFEKELEIYKKALDLMAEELAINKHCIYNPNCHIEALGCNCLLIENCHNKEWIKEFYIKKARKEKSEQEWSDEKIFESDSSEEVIKLRNPNDDLISREDLKKEIENLVAGGEKGLKDYYERDSKAEENSWIGGIYDAWELIKNAPTVTPEKALIDKLKGGAEE